MPGCSGGSTSQLNRTIPFLSIESLSTRSRIGDIQISAYWGLFRVPATLHSGYRNRCSSPPEQLPPDTADFTNHPREPRLADAVASPGARNKFATALFSQARCGVLFR